MAAAYTFRLATLCPDVTWDKKNNPIPWQKYANRRYKFYTENIDYKTYSQPSERPDI